MNKDEKHPIIIAYASVGSGHKVAALSVSKALQNVLKHGDLPEKFHYSRIAEIDILDYFAKKIDGNNAVSVSTGFLSPFYDFTWRKNFTGRISWAGGKLWPSFLYKQFEEYIKKVKPQAVICTHFVCANSAAKARTKMDEYFPIISIPTDYETEGLWPSQESDLFCVSSTQMARTLIRRKVPTNRIALTGMPVITKLEKDISRSQVQKKFQIPKGRKIAIVLAGASEPGPYKHIRKVLNGCIRDFGIMDNMHFIVCVGKDQDYAGKLKKLIVKHSCNNIKILQYTDNMMQLMNVADIALIKPGGLAITECASISLPVLLLGKTYGQENINRRFLIDYDAALHATTSQGVIDYLNLIMDNKKLYKKLKKNISRIANKDSAFDISNLVIDIISADLQDRPRNHKSIYLSKKPIHTW